MKTLTIATRKSVLALYQANLIKELLQQAHPELTIELNYLVTQGDRVQDRPLAEVGGKGLFLKELQRAVLANEADIAVHSAKDVPVEDVPGLAFMHFCQRVDPRDVLISKNHSSLSDLPQGAIVGTSSYRRQAQLLALRPDLIIKDLRGNIDTRLKKLARGDYAAIILAAAGLQRLNLTEHITQYFTFKELLPSVGQGALCIEARSDDVETQALLQCLADPLVTTQLTAERAFTKTLHGDCHTPIAVHASIENDMIILDGLVASLDGTQVVRAQQTAATAKAAELGETLAHEVLANGADKILQELK